MNEENEIESTPEAPVEAAPAPALSEASRVANAMREQIGRAVLGQTEVISQVLAALLAGGHVLLEGKPGLGKTQLVLAMAKSFSGVFGRIQFTPDLMPSDVTGFRLFDMKSQTFQLRKGPVFTNLLLADEINRAPAKTQSALLEVMQERQVTIDGESMLLSPPFMTLATQNPIEHEGTYPLPEAQLDRFVMKVLLDYPDAGAESEIVTRSAAEKPGSSPVEAVEAVATPEAIVAAQAETAAVRVVPEVVDYAVAIVKATRESQAVALGAGTRGAIALVRIGKAVAVLHGRSFVTPDDIKAAALPVLRHRVQLAPEVAIGGQDIDNILRGLVDSVPAPRQ
ncbi:AAA family ATPase [Haloferula sp. A504]|uniref:AAA family ATPase n=1 Tax=Haloferula sp. A504 TaxID=3373601 RepID=UPI0031C9E45B|nr:MoxR family ATPase [Verrucomicrobiaceae bacterium E54]